MIIVENRGILFREIFRSFRRILLRFNNINNKKYIAIIIIFILRQE